MSKVFLHIDGDAFFVGCEVSLNPRLRGLPVVTGGERSIITALSYEAKALGLTRTLPVFRVRKDFPQVIVLDSQYHAYQIFSQRMFAIVRRFTSEVEEYSIDECFADLSHYADPVDIARKIQASIHSELGLTVSVGLAPTKVLAKTASKQKKPHGFTSFLDEYNILDMSIGKIWGVGRATSASFVGYGITTVGHFLAKDFSWVSQYLAKPYQALWYELQGKSVLSLHTIHEDSQSIAHTRSFYTPSRSEATVWAELLKNIEGVCLKAREQGMDAREASIFIKTQGFEYISAQISFSEPLSDPISIARMVRAEFSKLFKKGILYRATGITLRSLVPRNSVHSLFSKPLYNKLFDIVDHLSYKHGEGILRLSGSKVREVEKRPMAILSLGTVS